MKKITFLMLHLNCGGLEKQTVTLINELVKQNKFKIEIISVYNILGKSFYEIDSKVKVKYLIPYGSNRKEIKESYNNGKYLKFIKEYLKGLKIIFLKYYLLNKEIKKLNTDYIFSTRIEFSKLIKRKDTINISQEHSYITDNRYVKKIKKSFEYIHYVIVMTHKAKEKYNKWVNNKTTVTVIPNIIDIKDTYVSSNESKKIISVGRLEEVKDFPLLLDIFEKVIKYNKDWCLEIIGSGSLKEELEEKINKLNLTNNVKLIDNIPTDMVYKELSKSSIFVLTSKSESFSLVLCEAMSVGLPVISFDIDVGPREIINDGINGYLVKNREADKMVEKILQLIQDEKLRKNLGSNARQSIQKYHSTNITNKWLDIIK